MLVATYAKRGGKAVAYSLAAFRQAFAGGRDLGDEGTVLIAAAACEMHPRAVLKAVAAALDAIGARRPCDACPAAGVTALPAIAAGRGTYCGERRAGARGATHGGLSPADEGEPGLPADRDPRRSSGPRSSTAGESTGSRSPRSPTRSRSCTGSCRPKRPPACSGACAPIWRAPRPRSSWRSGRTPAAAASDRGGPRDEGTVHFDAEHHRRARRARRSRETPRSRSRAGWPAAIARRAAEIRATVPDLELDVEVDAGKALALARAGGYSLTAILVRAAATALRELPWANAAYRDGHFERYGRVNVGVVVTTEDGARDPRRARCRREVAAGAHRGARDASSSRARERRADTARAGRSHVHAVGLHGARRRTGSRR